MRARLADTVRLCTARLNDGSELETAFKDGQMGPLDFLDRARGAVTAAARSCRGSPPR
jgi:hypothetical protein